MKTPEQFKEAMHECAMLADSDPEVAHGMADRLMLDLLRDLGYGEGCDVFVNMEKWYA